MIWMKTKVATPVRVAAWLQYVITAWNLRRMNYEQARTSAINGLGRRAAPHVFHQRHFARARLPLREHVPLRGQGRTAGNYEMV